MARLLVSLLFLLLILDINSSSLAWEPVISAVQEDRDRSLIITVTPKLNYIASLKVCLSELGKLPCLGHVTPMEGPANGFRYRVTELDDNQSYYIYIKPLDKNDRALDTWIHKKDPFFIEPWPPSSTTKAPEITRVPATTQKPKPARSTVGMEVVVIMLVLVVIAIVTFCILWRRGLPQRIWFLKRCLPQSHSLPPIKMLLLYVEDRFQPFVRQHMEFLGQYLRIDSVDCAYMRHKPNPDQWLDQSCADRRVIVYVTPRLMAELYSSETNKELDGTPGNSLAAKCVQVIHRLMTNTASLQKSRGRGRKPLFILSGCFPTDGQHEQFLSKDKILNSCQRFWVSKDHLLISPGPLLTKLSGCHRSLFSIGEWQNTLKAVELKNNISLLRSSTSVEYMESDIGNGPADFPDSDSVLDHRFEPPDGEPHDEYWNRENQCPHHMDNGCLSAMDLDQGSIPKSEDSSSSYVADGGEDIVDTDLRLPLFDSASPSSISFQPPESLGDMNSIMLGNAFRKFNEKGDWSALPQYRDADC